MNSIAIEVQKEELVLLPERGIYWPAKNALIVSDLHLGKAGHFRKHGIPVSRKVHLADIFILEGLIKRYQPERIILLGDLFHSFENLEWQDFIRFIAQYHTIQFELVKGNHDILGSYPGTLKVMDELQELPFSFTHIKSMGNLYNVSGHIHPGVTVRGKARQGMTFSCFLFSEQYAVLPAFGQFTGIKKIRPVKHDRIFVIADDQVIELV